MLVSGLVNDINDVDDDDDGAQSASHWLADVPFTGLGWRPHHDISELGQLASMSCDLRCELEVPDRVQLGKSGSATRAWRWPQSWATTGPLSGR